MGSTAARLKLKWNWRAILTGKRSMWLNWIKRLKSYQLVEGRIVSYEMKVLRGIAWLSKARVVRCCLVIHGTNRTQIGRNPHTQRMNYILENVVRQCEVYVKSSWSFRLGCTRAAIVGNQRQRDLKSRNVGRTSNFSTDRFLKLEIVRQELQVIVKHHVTVTMLKMAVHTARQSFGIGVFKPVLAHYVWKRVLMRVGETRQWRRISRNKVAVWEHVAGKNEY